MYIHLILIYFGILIGVIFEGEMVVLASVIAAHHGHLNIWIVLAIAFTGTICSDWFYFFLGRKHGKAWLYRKKHSRPKLEKVHYWMEKRPILIIILYRFMYGFRTVTPLMMGTGNLRIRTFVSYSLISILIWACFYVGLGYTFGEIIKHYLHDLKYIEFYIIAFLILGGIGYIVFKKRKERNSQKEGTN